MRSFFFFSYNTLGYQILVAQGCVFQIYSSFLCEQVQCIIKFFIFNLSSPVSEDCCCRLFIVQALSLSFCHTSNSVSASVACLCNSLFSSVSSTSSNYEQESFLCQPMFPAFVVANAEFKFNTSGSMLVGRYSHFEFWSLVPYLSTLVPDCLSFWHIIPLYVHTYVSQFYWRSYFQLCFLLSLFLLGDF